MRARLRSGVPRHLTTSWFEIRPIVAEQRKDIMIERIRYRFMARDPAVDLPIGYRKQPLELLEPQAIETLEMRIGEGGEDECNLAESASLGAKQRLRPARF